MFNWRKFLTSLAVSCGAIVFVAIGAGGFYIMCEMGNPCGFALIVGDIALGISVAVGDFSFVIDGYPVHFHVPNSRSCRSAKYWMPLPESPKEE